MTVLGVPRQVRGRRSPLLRGVRVALVAALGASVSRLAGNSLDFTAISRCAPHMPGHVARYGRIIMESRGGEASDNYEVGDRVKAISPDDEQWYPGYLEKINADGTFTVKWDDPDGGPETNDVTAEALKKIIIFKDYVVGDDVQAMPPDDEHYYPGVVSKVNGDGTFTVSWDDPDGGPASHDVKPDAMKKVSIFKDYKVDDAVEAAFPDDGNMYGAVVTKVNGDGTFTVKWDDSDGGPEESIVQYKNMRIPPIPFEKLEVGQKYHGTVEKVLDFGAFVDFGADRSGMVHISKVTVDRIDNIYDHVEDGQEVDVWVSELRDDGKIALTMVESKIGRGGGGAPKDVTPFEGVSPDEWLSGVVARTAPFGAFVTVTAPTGETADGLVHISQIRDGFVDNVDDELSVGQEVQVRVSSVDMESRKMSLSMKEAFGGGGGAPRAPVDLTAFEGMESQWLKGKVARIAPFGVFVTVTHPKTQAQADGLVHITQIRDGYVESPEDEVEVGQEVDVWIQSVDTSANKMSLSMKQNSDGEVGEY